MWYQASILPSLARQPRAYNPRMKTALLLDRAGVEAGWAERVRRNREQVERVREVPDGGDFYGPVASSFRADPQRDDRTLRAVLTHAQAGDTWLDIGAGGGRFALPIAQKVARVIAVEPSPGMREVLQSGIAEQEADNIEVVDTRWPSEQRFVADCALIANVGNDVEDIGSFLDAMEASARRRCVAVMSWQRPTVLYDQLWPAVHGEPRDPLPAVPEFLQVLLARGRVFDIQLSERSAHSHDAPDGIINFLYRQTWVKPGSEKDRKLRESLAEAIQERDGGYALSWDPVPVAVISWDPQYSTR